MLAFIKLQRPSNVSVNSSWVHPLRQPPEISSGGRDLTLESCPGAENSTRAGFLHMNRCNIIIALHSRSQLSNLIQQVELKPDMQGEHIVSIRSELVGTL